MICDCANNILKEPSLIDSKQTAQLSDHPTTQAMLAELWEAQT